MKIGLPEVITPVTEEIWYLVHNQDFIKAVQKLRKKYDIPEEGLGENVSSWATRDKLGQTAINFTKEVSLKIFPFTRGSKTMHEYEFRNALVEYILTNKVEKWKGNYGLLSRPYPHMSIETADGKVKITVYADFDSTIEQITEIIRLRKEKIKKLQRKLSGSKMKSTMFKRNVDIWEAKRIDEKKITAIIDEVYKKNP